MNSMNPMQTMTRASDLLAQRKRRGQQRVDVQLGILEDAGVTLPQGAAILDLGCGNGDLVAEYRRRGYRAYGCDFSFKPGPNVAELERAGHIRLIEPAPYRMPFEDGQFDLVVSNEVFEHVQNYGETLAEHRRVLKRSGVGLHTIPSRYSPIEGHVFVPLATIIQDYWWLRVWAQLGIRTATQQGIDARQCARRNEEYLKNCTNYLSKAQLNEEFAQHFREVQFVEKLFLKRSKRARFLHDMAAALPFIPSMYSTLRSRVVLCAPDASYRGGVA